MTKPTVNTICEAVNSTMTLDAIQSKLRHISPRKVRDMVYYCRIAGYLKQSKAGDASGKSVNVYTRTNKKIGRQKRSRFTNKELALQLLETRNNITSADLARLKKITPSASSVALLELFRDNKVTRHQIGHKFVYNLPNTDTPQQENPIRRPENRSNSRSLEVFIEQGEHLINQLESVIDAAREFQSMASRELG